MVGLGPSGGEDYVRPLRLGLRQQELQLPDLVATQAHAGHIVPLDVDVLAQLPAQVLQLVHGRGQHAQRDRFKFCNLFHDSLLVRMFVPPILPSRRPAGKGEEPRQRVVYALVST